MGGCSCIPVACLRLHASTVAVLTSGGVRCQACRNDGSVWLTPFACQVEHSLALSGVLCTASELRVIRAIGTDGDVQWSGIGPSLVGVNCNAKYDQESADVSVQGPRAHNPVRKLAPAG